MSRNPFPGEDDPRIRRNLPRLPRAAYQGFAYGHWVLTMRDRKRGWLDEAFFLRFQLAATHAFLRYRVVAPCVCLMPDHVHLLVVGIDAEKSDQVLAMSFLRKHLKEALAQKGCEFQRPPYDHVLRDEERERGSFENHAAYIRQNPVRANLIEESEESPFWPYECAIVPGYPDLDVRADDFWERFWRIYYDKLLVS